MSVPFKLKTSAASEPLTKHDARQADSDRMAERTKSIRNSL
ncbi:MAG TPA: hypothetical protein VKX25_02240 [Bryobacteraceae bacterium]|jgi:hypothetical protein|nr:hypothetical protein [Bryobacteraceae bacterium]